MTNNNEAAERRRIMMTGVVMIVVLVAGAGAAFYFVRVGLQGGAENGGAAGEAHRQVRVKRPEGEFVGSAKCAACHAEVAAKYASSAKAHSFLPLAEADEIENYKVGTLLDSPHAYRVEKSAAGQVTHHEYLTGVYDQGEPIDYVLGSGKRERAYVLERSGVLFQSPVVWRAAESAWKNANHNDGSPTSRRFDARITDDCLRCHAGSVHSAGLGTNRYQTPPFIQSAIGCESCHGPGGRHVAKYEANPNPTGETDDTIVNPAKLGSRRVDHLCSSCHLHGYDTIPRHGASLLDFRPGMLLEDVYSVLLPAPKNDTEFRRASHPTQLRASNCYLESQGKLNCQTCHDPHGDPPNAERPAYFNSKCSTCHEDQGCSLAPAKRDAAPAMGSCITCHMPTIEENVNIHSARTDHRIRKRPDLYIEERTEFKLNELAIFDQGGQRVSPEVNQRALNLALLRTALRNRDLKLAEKATRAIMPTSKKPDESIVEMTDDLPLVSSIGKMLGFAQQGEAAAKCWQQILEYYPTHEETLLWVTRAAFERGDMKSVLEFTETWLAAQPRASGARAYRAMALKNEGDLLGAIKEAELVLKLNPPSIPMRQFLEGAYRENGQTDLADEQAALIVRQKALSAPGR